MDIVKVVLESSMSINLLYLIAAAFMLVGLSGKIWKISSPNLISRFACMVVAIFLFCMGFVLHSSILQFKAEREVQKEALAKTEAETKKQAILIEAKAKLVEASAKLQALELAQARAGFEMSRQTKLDDQQRSDQEEESYRRMLLNLNKRSTLPVDDISSQ